MMLGRGGFGGSEQDMKRARRKTRKENFYWIIEAHFGIVLFALNQTLRQHEGVREGIVQGSFTTEDLITHYNCGDLSSIIFNHDTSQLPHFLNSSLLDHERSTAQQIDSYLRQELIYKRNARMARRVSALLQRSPAQSFFFAFGAGNQNNPLLSELDEQAALLELSYTSLPF
ncbi:metalloprotease TIKI2 [Tachysurus ichikawai]